MSVQIHSHAQVTAAYVMSENFATHNRHMIGNHLRRNGERLCRSLVARRATRSSRVRYASAACATRPHSLPNPTQAQKLNPSKSPIKVWLVCGSCLVVVVRSRRFRVRARRRAGSG